MYYLIYTKGSLNNIWDITRIWTNSFERFPLHQIPNLTIITYSCMHTSRVIYLSFTVYANKLKKFQQDCKHLSLSNNCDFLHTKLEQNKANMLMTTAFSSYSKSHHLFTLAFVDEGKDTRGANNRNFLLYFAFHSSLKGSFQYCWIRVCYKMD